MKNIRSRIDIILYVLTMIIVAYLLIYNSKFIIYNLSSSYTIPKSYNML
jgi:hypothetical protein